MADMFTTNFQAQLLTARVLLSVIATLPKNPRILYMVLAPPFVKEGYRDGKIFVDGMFGLILQALGQFVPFSYDVTYDPRKSYGVRLANGSFNGIVGLLQRGEADLAAAPVIMLYDRAQVATYTPVMYTSEFALIAVAGESSVNAFSYLFVFDWEVWAGLVACIPLVSAALAFVEKRRRRNGTSFALEMYDNTWDILRSFSYEGHTAEAKSHAGRLLFSLWWLTVLVLTNGFAGQLKASLAIKSEPPRFRSAEDITFRPNIRPLIWKDTGFEAYVRTSTRPSLQALTRQVHRHGGFASISEMYSKVAMEQLYSGRAVIISDRDVSMHMLAKQCRLTGGRLYVAPELLFTRFLTVAHAKGMKPSLVRRIHGKMRAIMESGLHLKWYNDGVEDWHRCQAMQGAGASRASEMSFNVLSYDDLGAIFSLWALMAALSLCVFLLELGFSRATKGRNYRLQRIAAMVKAKRQRLLRGQTQMVLN